MTRRDPPRNTGHRYTKLHFRVLLRSLRAGPAVFSTTKIIRMGSVLSSSRLKSGVVDKPSNPTDRRHSVRRKARLEAELTVSLSLLDTGTGGDETLLLMGETHDVSAEGVAIVVPSIRIDEKYCEEERPLKMSLHLQSESVQMQLQTIHCNRLEENDPDRGYIIGARITDFGGLGPVAWGRLVRKLADTNNHIV